MKIVLLLSFVILLLSACKTTHHFPALLGPIAKSAKMVDWIPPKDSIKVISFNIEYALKIDEAIRELKEISDLQNADILLLQEMDEVGTQSIAKALHFNYLYYPATINNNNQNLFGNAILSKWPLLEEKKMVLPHPNPHNGGIRIAMGAKVYIGEKKVGIYNVHSETIVLKGKKRRKQHDFLAHEIAHQE